MSPGIATRNDLNVKNAQREENPEGGHRVKVTVRFRGAWKWRNTDIGEQLLIRFGEGVRRSRKRWIKTQARRPVHDAGSCPAEECKNNHKGEEYMPKLKTHSGGEERYSISTKDR